MAINIISGMIKKIEIDYICPEEGQELHATVDKDDFDIETNYDQSFVSVSFTCICGKTHYLALVDFPI